MVTRATWSRRGKRFPAGKANFLIRKKGLNLPCTGNLMKKENELNSEQALFRLIAEGDEPAFKALFECYRLRLFAFALQFTHSRTDAEEVVQDVFLKIWKNRLNLANIQLPQKYIYTMTRNQVFDHLSRVARNKRLHEQVWANIHESGDYTEQAVLAAETANIVQKAVNGLSSRKQSIYYLSRREGLSNQEIAVQLGISVPTVKNSLVEILRYIRTYMSNQYESSVLIIGFLLSFFL